MIAANVCIHFIFYQTYKVLRRFEKNSVEFSLFWARLASSPLYLMFGIICVAFSGKMYGVRFLR